MILCMAQVLPQCGLPSRVSGFSGHLKKSPVLLLQLLQAVAAREKQLKSWTLLRRDKRKDPLLLFKFGLN